MSNQEKQVKKQTDQQIKQENEYKVENKYDPYELRDVFNQFISDILSNKEEIKESNKYNIHKIIVGIFITAVVILSHFAPIPWPDNYIILIFCIISYYVLSHKYQNYEEKVEGECFFLFNYQDKMLMRFTSDIKDYSDKIDFTIESDSDRSDIIVQKSIEYKDYIDKRGYLHTEKFQKVLDQMMEKVKQNFSKKNQ